MFLGAGHASNERKAWAVIALCSAMMVLEIGGGIAFGSLTLHPGGLPHGPPRESPRPPRFNFSSGSRREWRSGSPLREPAVEVHGVVQDANDDGYPSTST